MRHRRQMQRRVGRAARGGDGHRGILERFARHDLARPELGLEQFHHLLAGGGAEGIADFVGRRRAAAIGQREADGLGDHRHGVGGVLAAAGAGGGARDALHLVERDVVHLADGVEADGLEQILDDDVAALVAARQDRAAIDEDRRHVEADHRHHHARQRFVAAGHGDERVIAMAAHGELDRVGDDVAAGQRRLHAGVAHRHAVGDRDGGEFARRAVIGGNALFDGLRLALQRDVAGRGLVPGGRHADQWLVNLLAREAHRVKVGAVRRPLRPFGHMPARQPRFVDVITIHLPTPPDAASPQSAVSKALYRLGPVRGARAERLLPVRCGSASIHSPPNFQPPPLLVVFVWGEIVARALRIGFLNAG